MTSFDTPPLAPAEPLYPMVDDDNDNIDDFVPPRRRRVLPSATWALLFVLVGAGGFVAGVKAQHSAARAVFMSDTHLSSQWSSQT